MNWLPITILVYTYDRPRRIRKVLESLQKHVKYSGELLWRIADDGSPPGYLEDIAADFPELKLQWTVTGRLGFGANANKGYRACTTKYVLPTEDDLLIIRDLDLDMGITLMEGVPTIGALRYGVHLVGLVLHGHVFHGKQLLPYYVLNRQKCRHWNPCGHPVLIQPSYYKAYGLLPEGVMVGQVELAWTRKAVRIDGPDVAVLPPYATGYYPFVHLSHPRLGGTERDAGYMIQRGKKPT